MSSDPQLPLASPKVLNGLSQTFAFHSSPEAFIASCTANLHAHRPDLAASRTTLQAKILNRDVAVISSHAQIQHILALPDAEQRDNGEEEPALVAAGAYRQFLADFFPGPNLLLSDGVAHKCMRGAWEARMRDQSARMHATVKGATTRHFAPLSGGVVDLYSSLKSLAWKIVLGVFLGLDESDPGFCEVQELQEDLLRGQFSLFPVSVNLMVWRSPRSRGIAARDKLQQFISRRLKTLPGQCPFDATTGSDEEVTQVVNHVLMFTSSLAVKGIASLLTATLLNVFIYKKNGVSLLDDILSRRDNERGDFLRSVMLETERLSPPIVGIMRRVTRDIVVPSGSTNGRDVLIPSGWDAWLYFVGGARDPGLFGDDCDQFHAERFLNTQDSAASGLAFGASSKKCLGQGIVRGICADVVEGLLDEGFRLKGDVTADGVRAWLGWQMAGSVTSPEAWARDMKQLPTQRPAKPIMVSASR